MKNSKEYTTELNGLHGEISTAIREKLGENKNRHIALNIDIPIAWYNGKPSIKITHFDMCEGVVYTNDSDDPANTMRIEEITTKNLITILERVENGQVYIPANFN